jgi:antitoxin VapB
VVVTAEHIEVEYAARSLRDSGTCDSQYVIAMRLQGDREKRRAHIHNVIKEIQDEVSKLPVLDDRTPDEILGYDEWGLPH